jgi:transcriptional regulator with XRE-family HTH domain
MPSDLKDTVAARIRSLRMAQRLSQEALADLCHLHRTYIGAVERGERNITLRTLQCIAEALGVGPADLLQGVYTPEGRS